MTLEELKNIDEDFERCLKESDRKYIKDFIKNSTRISILEKMRNDLHIDIEDDEDDTFEAISGKNRASQSFSYNTSAIVLDEWINELEDTKRKMLPKVVAMIYTPSALEYFNTLKGKFKDIIISQNLPEVACRSFLNQKFGNEDSLSKEAIKSICSEAINYYHQVIFSK